MCAVGRGTVCERLPLVATALANGTVTAGHVDAIANASRQLDDDGKERLADHEQSLVEAAASSTPEQFERECQDLARNLSGDDGLSRQERMRVCCEPSSSPGVRCRSSRGPGRVCRAGRALSISLPCSRRPVAMRTPPQPCVRQYAADAA